VHPRRARQGEEAGPVGVPREGAKPGRFRR
jgi:hypothetical protein